MIGTLGCSLYSPLVNEALNINDSFLFKHGNTKQKKKKLSSINNNNGDSSIILLVISY